MTTFFNKYRASRVFETSKEKYAPGSDSNGLVSDPLFVKAVADPRLLNDYRLTPKSPAANAGVKLPAEWPDPMRPMQAGKPDVGTLPPGNAPLAAGRGAAG